MRTIKISVTDDAIAYAREHLWGNDHGWIVGLVQFGTGVSCALMHAPMINAYYAGLNGELVEVLDSGTIEARIALARIGAQGGRAGKGVARPAVSVANKERWAQRQDKKGGAL